MTTPLPIDELNTLRSSMQELFGGDLPQSDKERLARDGVFDFLVMTYLLGYDFFNYSTGENAEPDADRAREVIYERIADKDFAERVQAYATTGDLENIMRVADTDMTRVFSAAGLDAARSTQGNYKKRWNTMEDERVRSTHDYIADMAVGLDEVFATWDGDTALAPGGFSLPQNNVNCRCWLDFVQA